MSDAKFASITAALLVRKGEAAPSMISPAMREPLYRPPAPPRAPAVETKPAPVVETKPTPRFEAAAEAARVEARPVAVAAPALHADRKRRLVVTLSAEEYMRLGIMAAKKNSTRHDLVRDVVFAELAAFGQRAAADCRCINDPGACDCVNASESSDPADPSVDAPAPVLA